ncbi:LacI family transcriptional regulator [Microcella alkaliphila]|uniref:LacI family transcriptional regulator n=1 Tax=Microcella alkaliphila TaxID=279828 RepID=A0A4Q7TSV0_9MICO|nr:LacI family DNA-binding transcriptional regulator [Microcella alkaliphila]RZT64091.1 LacI family transcriptional regulator [Microcella alkaliphila]
MAEPRTRPKRATIFDVAAEAGVSRGTVSRVLNGEPYVSQSAREAIEAAIEKVGYVRNTAARNLATQSSGAVALIVHEPHSVFVEDPNIGAILLGTNAALSEADYQLVSLIIDTDRDTERVVSYLGGGFVDGAIVVSAREDDPIADALQRLRIPTVLVGRPDTAPELPSVSIDNRTSARQITERLVATGRRRIGMIAAALDRDSGRDRLAGFRDALGDRFDATLVVDVPLYSFHAGQEGMRALLDRAPDINGVFAASDAIAAGAVDVLRADGRRIPDDVGVVGFDDSAWALRCQPALSTVRQPADRLGARAAELVLDEIRTGERRSGVVLLPTEVVWRDSA